MLDAIWSAASWRTSSSSVARLALPGCRSRSLLRRWRGPRLEPLIETTTPGLYTLRHDLIAEAVLRRVAPEQAGRDSRHTRAGHLRCLAPAFHLASAGDPKASGVAARRARRRRRRPPPPERGCSHLAVECGDADDPILRLDAAEALSRTGRYRDAIELLENAEFADRCCALRRETVLSVATGPRRSCLGRGWRLPEEPR